MPGLDGRASVDGDRTDCAVRSAFQSDWNMGAGILVPAAGVVAVLLPSGGSATRHGACHCGHRPILHFPALFNYDGGSCDFRMDASLYVFFALAAIWLLIAVQSRSVVPWLIWGIWGGRLTRPRDGSGLFRGCVWSVDWFGDCNKPAAITKFHIHHIGFKSGAGDLSMVLHR